jgi:carboxypeptidase C (cathepsin A)
MYTLNHMGLDKESRSRVSFTYYPAGHMMYTEVSSRIKFHADVREFVKACLAN